MKAKLILFWITLTLSKTLLAQTTETFESSTVNVASFTNGLSTFNLATNGIKFTVVNMSGLGYNGSARFIQVDDTYGQIATITKTSGTFKMNSLWLFVTGNATQDPGAPLAGQGSVTFRGKLANVTKFTVVKNSGFATNFDSPGNGFGLVNFATEGGVNNTGIDIDQLEIQLNANFDYFAIDNFTFSLPVLPITLANFTTKAEGNHAKLQWQTSAETNNKGFEIYRSGDDKQFVKIGDENVQTDNYPSVRTYAFTDKKPLNGNNYYKLVQVDNDGKATELAVRTVAFNLMPSTFSLSPNPTKDKVTVQFETGKFGLVILSNTEGKVVRKLSLKPHEKNVEVDLTPYPSGIYFVRLQGNDDSITHKVIKQ